MNVMFSTSVRRHCWAWGVLVSILVQGYTGHLLAREGEAASTRPTIGVCLGGGGAKGLAHIGVLRVLEELQIPVDYIGGTSMGAIIGGFYAVGMSPDEIEHFMITQDWWDLLQDNPHRRRLAFRRKEEQFRYVSEFEFGLKGFTPKIPNGLIAGQKLNDVLQAVTAHTGSVNHFDDLNIPFRAVACDIRTGQPVILDRGDLAQAIRASMAVPGAFTPVTHGDRILVDGGLVNNVPVDVVRAMGADIVIAVDVSGVEDWTSKDRNMDSVANILGQTLAIFQQPNTAARMEAADITIHISVADQGAGDFHKGEQIIPLGVKAAQAHKPGLEPYRVDREAYERFLAGHRYRPLDAGTIGTVCVRGNLRVDERIIRNRITTQPGDAVDYGQIRMEAGQIHGFGDFVSVLHLLHPAEDGQDLEYLVHEKPWGPTYLRFGLRLETDFDNNAYWNVLLNISRRRLNALGGEASLDLQVGRESGAYADFYQPLDFSETFFISPSVWADSRRTDIYDGKDRVAQYNVDSMTGALDVGLSFREYGEARVGYDIGVVEAGVDSGEPDLPSAKDTQGALHGRLVLDRLDDAFFPSTGYRLYVVGRVADEALGSEVSFQKLEGIYSLYHGMDRHTTWLRVRGGTGFSSELPPYAALEAGGMEDFGGFAPGQLRGAYIGIAALGYRFRISRLPPGLGDGIYLALRAEAGNAWPESDVIGTDDLRYGGTAALAADTLIGPFYLGYGYANGGYSRAFMALGTRF